MFILIAIAHAATQAHEAAAPSGISAIGLDGKALLFQIINFTILLLLLRWFAYRPILNVLKARRERIEESLKTAQEIEVAKAALATDKQEIITAARRDAQEIVNSSKQQAQQILQAAHEDAKNRTEQTLKAADAQLESNVAQVRVRLKHEVSSLVAQATETIIDVKLDPAKDAELIKKAIQEVEMSAK